MRLLILAGFVLALGLTGCDVVAGALVDSLFDSHKTREERRE